MPQIDQFGTNYLTLTLEINKHIDGYVDAYIGPPNLKAQVETGEKKPPQALMADLEALRAALPNEDHARAKYLTAVFRAMDCTLLMLDGEEFAYLDEVERLFDIKPKLVDERQFASAHNQMDTHLPGSGNLTDRYNQWRAQFDIPVDKLQALLDLATEETRDRTQKFVDLVEGEGIEYELVADKPWVANNVYLGTARSLVEVNMDIPTNATALADLIAHEGYPGNHTELMLKEKLLYQGKGYAEIASVLLHSPWSVTAEAIATTAAEIIFPGDSLYEWTAQVAIPAAGLPNISAQELRAILAPMNRIRAVGANAAIQYHSGEFSQEDVIEYMQTYNLMSENRATKAFEFMSHPLYRAYIFTYSEGYELLEQAAVGGDKQPVFEWLLVEQVLPSELVE